MCYAAYFVKNSVDQHICGMKQCSVCRCDRNVLHHCFIPPLSFASSNDEENDGDDQNNIEIEKPIHKTIKAKRKRKQKKILYIFFDFETVQDKRLPGESEKFEHSVNLAVAQTLVCETCRVQEDIKEECTNCGKREHMFLGGNSLELFMLYLVEKIEKKCTKVICIAHYMKGFDGHFCLKIHVSEQ